MTKLLHHQKYCKLVDETEQAFIKQLGEHLSFKYAGVEFSPAFQNGFWDGKEKLLSKKLEFYSGLLNYVKDFYAANDRPLEIVDCRTPTIAAAPLDISESLARLRLTPYDYQLEAVKLAKQNDRVIFKHATGSGKSLTSAMITAELNKPTIVYVISKELLHQFYEFFSSIFNEEIGIVGDGICETKRITIASIWTIGKALGMKSKDILLDDSAENEKYDESNTKKIIDCVRAARIIHFDECHICAAKTVKTIYKAIQPEKILAYSGTPRRDDGADLLLQGILGDNIHEVKASELIKRGILAKPMIKFLPVGGHVPFDANYHTVYSEHVVNNQYRNNLVCKEAQKLIEKGYQVLVLFKTLTHGKILKDLFDEKGIDAEFLSGKDTTKKRAEVKEKLLSKQSMCIIASMVYDIGIDIPTLNALILTGSGKSSVKTLQRIGRVIRNGTEKPVAAIVEFADGVKYLKKHSLIRKSIYETEPEFVIKFPEMKKK